MPDSFADNIDLERIAREVDTPFYLYSAEVLRRRLQEVRGITASEGLQARYAMKACSTRRILEVIREHDLWIDAVSGNEALRAQRVGFATGTAPPIILFTADVFRDNALSVVQEHGILPNVGSPGMIAELATHGYRAAIGVRLNPGFGHGHVQACDTGGPSSKHGVWHEDAGKVRAAAARAGMPIVLLHAHVGSGPTAGEFCANLNRLADFFAEHVAHYPDLEAVNLGGGIPHAYRDGDDVDIAALEALLVDARKRINRGSVRPLRLEIEPGRYCVAPAGVLVTRVVDVKETRSNERGPGYTFAMVDAGFCDLLRPAMYGAYHHISIHGRDAEQERIPLVVAGPLCESGDVFTRDAGELLQPRLLPRPRPKDILVLHDTGAYGAAMSSRYVSTGRAAAVWWEDGQASLIERRETIDDITRLECYTPLGIGT